MAYSGRFFILQGQYPAENNNSSKQRANASKQNKYLCSTETRKNNHNQQNKLQTKSLVMAENTLNAYEELFGDAEVGYMKESTAQGNSSLADQDAENGESFQSGFKEFPNRAKIANHLQTESLVMAENTLNACGEIFGGANVDYMKMSTSQNSICQDDRDAHKREFFPYASKGCPDHTNKVQNLCVADAEGSQKTMAPRNEKTNVKSIDSSLRDSLHELESIPDSMSIEEAECALNVFNQCFGATERVSVENDERNMRKLESVLHGMHGKQKVKPLESLNLSQSQNDDDAAKIKKEFSQKQRRKVGSFFDRNKVCPSTSDKPKSNIELDVVSPVDEEINRATGEQMSTRATRKRSSSLRSFESVQRIPQKTRSNSLEDAFQSLAHYDECFMIPREDKLLKIIQKHGAHLMRDSELCQSIENLPLGEAKTSDEMAMSGDSVQDEVFFEKNNVIFVKESASRNKLDLSIDTDKYKEGEKLRPRCASDSSCMLKLQEKHQQKVKTSNQENVFRQRSQSNSASVSRSKWLNKVQNGPTHEISPKSPLYFSYNVQQSTRDDQGRQANIYAPNDSGLKPEMHTVQVHIAPSYEDPNSSGSPSSPLRRENQYFFPAAMKIAGSMYGSDSSVCSSSEDISQNTSPRHLRRMMVSPLLHSFSGDEIEKVYDSDTSIDASPNNSRNSSTESSPCNSRRQAVSPLLFSYSGYETDSQSKYNLYSESLSPGSRTFHLRRGSLPLENSYGKSEPLSMQTSPVQSARKVSTNALVSPGLRARRGSLPASPTLRKTLLNKRNSGPLTTSPELSPKLDTPSTNDTVFRSSKAQSTSVMDSDSSRLADVSL